MQDIAQALSSSLDRDGKGGMRANLNMGGFKLTNMAQGTNPGDPATVGQASVPVGTVLDYCGTLEPTGYLFCYGQAVSRTAYPYLFGALSTLYGAGDGVNTFNVPDLRGRAVAGKDNMGGTAAGRLNNAGAGIAGATLGAGFGAQSHTLTQGQMPAHSHGLTDPGHAHTVPGSVTGSGGIGVGSGLGQSDLPTTAATTGIAMQNTGGGESHNNVQPTFVLNKIIKAVL